ncbi:hypothetical protein [Streptomyces subrutilus]|uniref:Uncharacterized protein n=1 Tax=Streptomyces subrutilus TaxID=36818 RepID=A0A918QJ32_9ACTN|nr:hypothetical protein [Streptomyces subrutilus]WSJ31497.1 hypothetical protein OG479_20680 [Streptomyces subrutilus]GGZ53531.1 hypothetical protein GCM10010371_11340 [Streptomyces subrutilus]
MSDASKRTLRTLVQTALALAVLLPAVIDASGLPATLPWVAGALAAAGALTRVMALPGVQAVLPGWLRTEWPYDRDRDLLALATRPESATGSEEGDRA